ncbi:RNA-binding protein [Candidatus Daviesbacteria bacterium]|nr:RNA-binding protein [Candidatus Daviesbacteria bacterium]
MTKLFVGGLPYSIDNQKLNDLFAEFGQVLSAVIITDKYTGQSKGFGFVEIADDAGAQEAIKKLDGSDLEGRRLGVSVARPREERSNSYSNDRRSDFRDNNRNYYQKNRR